MEGGKKSYKPFSKQKLKVLYFCSSYLEICLECWIISTFTLFHWHEESVNTQDMFLKRLFC